MEHAIKDHPDYLKIQEFKKKLVNTKLDVDAIMEYQGSVKGMTPEEDEVAFEKWWNENKPDSIREIEEEYLKKQYFKEQKMVPKAKETIIDDDIHHDATDWVYFSKYDNEFRLDKCEEMPMWEICNDDQYQSLTFSNMRTTSPHIGGTPISEEMLSDDEDAEKTAQLEENEDESKNKKFPEISPIPAGMITEYQQAMHRAHDYACFRGFMSMHNLLRSKYRLNFDSMLFSVAASNQPKDLPAIPSIFAYYETLPEFVRERTEIKTLVQHLEVSLIFYENLNL